MKVGFLITARLKSTRLPRKALREIEGKPFITYMIERVKLSPLIDKIVLATSTNPEDDPLCDLAKQQGI
ncbi:3-deoxy-manno-octulosonate cytidylyltransferase, partial [Candidatus Woesearchaeota archaeon]|nr:3-deoxy-manno-octulosonate cytidylyltransferase [Candidatus Woesearchaeota archaeon]